MSTFCLILFIESLIDGFPGTHGQPVANPFERHGRFLPQPPPRAKGAPGIVTIFMFRSISPIQLHQLFFQFLQLPSGPSSHPADGFALPTEMLHL
jgi:hypothetical protein